MTSLKTKLVYPNAEALPGSSGERDLCIHGDEQHEKRHQGIAEMLHVLNRIKAERVQHPPSPMPPKALLVSPLSPNDAIALFGCAFGLSGGEPDDEEGEDGGEVECGEENLGDA